MVGRGKVKGRVDPTPDQTFQAESTELLFLSIALKVELNFMDSLYA